MPACGSAATTTIPSPSAAILRSLAEDFLPIIHLVFANQRKRG